MTRTASPTTSGVVEHPLEVDAFPAWEYLIVALPPFVHASHAPGASDAVSRLNEEGGHGWEAVTMTPLADGTIAVLFKRRLPL
jgi:hypothetical protein